MNFHWYSYLNDCVIKRQDVNEILESGVFASVQQLFAHFQVSIFQIQFQSVWRLGNNCDKNSYQGIGKVKLQKMSQIKKPLSDCCNIPIGKSGFGSVVSHNRKLSSGFPIFSKRFSSSRVKRSSK